MHGAGHGTNGSRCPTIPRRMLVAQRVPAPARPSRRLWQATVALLVLFVALAGIVNTGALRALDQALMDMAKASRDCTLLAFAQATNPVFAIEASVGLAVVASGVLWRLGYGPWSLAPWLVFGSLALEVTLKLWMHQPSPPFAWPYDSRCDQLGYPFPLSLSSPNSFPSGYSIRMGFFVVLAALLAGVRGHRQAARLLTVLGTAVVLVLAWSRVYVNWHWPMDVLGGVLLGAALAALVAWLLEGRRAPTA